MTKQKALLALMISGDAKWEPFNSNDGRGEVCVNGLRYSSKLDSDGVPVIYPVLECHLRHKIACIQRQKARSK